MKKLIINLLLILLTISSYGIEPEVSKYFEPKIAKIQNKLDEYSNNGKITINAIIIEDKDVIEMLWVVDCLSGMNIVYYSNENALFSEKFDCLKDWYFLNKNKLSMDLINEAKALTVGDELINKSSSYIRHKQLIDRIKIRNIDYYKFKYE